MIKELFRIFFGWIPSVRHEIEHEKKVRDKQEEEWQKTSRGASSTDRFGG